MGKILAYLLIVTEIGKEYEIAKALLEIKSVKEARTVYGEFDVIAKIEAEGVRKLDTVITKIRKMKGVTRTITLISPG
jgi:DNA-binding Lrp family transcriptional regulator